MVVGWRSLWKWGPAKCHGLGKPCSPGRCSPPHFDHRWNMIRNPWSTIGWSQGKKMTCQWYWQTWAIKHFHFNYFRLHPGTSPFLPKEPPRCSSRSSGLAVRCHTSRSGSVTSPFGAAQRFLQMCRRKGGPRFSQCLAYAETSVNEGDGSRNESQDHFLLMDHLWK